MRGKVSVGRVISCILEGIWTAIKLIVVVGIIVTIVGVLLSRDLMIRGRSGDFEILQNESVSSVVSENKEAEDKKTAKWLKKVELEKVTLVSDDKKIMVARKVVQKTENDNWVVILHGLNGSMEDIYDIARNYYTKDYNVLMPDLRASGESEGSFYGMGWLDRIDIINWVDVILQDNPSAKVVVHGIDMGADAALMLSGEAIKSSIKVVIAEGAYTSGWEAMKKEYEKRYDLPVFPILNMINPVMKIVAGYSLKEADAVKQVEQAKVPILLIYGTKDSYTNEEMANKLNQAIVSAHEQLMIEEGTHGDCRYVNPEQYYNTTFKFIENYVIK